MKTSWWFDLYTKPFFKRLGAFSAFYVLMELVLGYFNNGPLLRFISFISFLYVLLPSRNTFIYNLDFHKIHMPFPDLRRAFIYNALLRTGSVIGVLFCCFILMKLLGYEQTHFLFQFADSTIITKILLSCALGIFLFCSHFASPNFEMAKRFSFCFSERFFLRFMAIFFFIVFATIILTLSMAAFNSGVVYYEMGLILFSFMMAYFLHRFRASFHLEKERISFSRSLSYFCGCLFLTSSLFTFLLWQFLPQVNDPGLSPSYRYSLFQASRTFSPILTKDSMRVFIPQVKSVDEFHDLFDKYPGTEFDLGIEPYILKPNTYFAISIILLRKKTRAPDSFLLSLMDYVNNNTKDWKNSDRLPLISMVHIAWGKKRAFPPQYAWMAEASIEYEKNEVQKRKLASEKK